MHVLQPCTDLQKPSPLCSALRRHHPGEGQLAPTSLTTPLIRFLAADAHQCPAVRRNHTDHHPPRALQAKTWVTLQAQSLPYQVCLSRSCISCQPTWKTTWCDFSSQYRTEGSFSVQPPNGLIGHDPHSSPCIILFFILDTVFHRIISVSCGQAFVVFHTSPAKSFTGLKHSSAAGLHRVQAVPMCVSPKSSAGIY